MAKSQKSLFPPASVMLSRAWWFACDHPGGVIVLGLGGCLPFCTLFLLFTQEAETSVYLQDAEISALLPLAYGLALVNLLRYLFRLALGRWMSAVLIGLDRSWWGSLAWACLHAPTALFYGSLSVVGWVLGSVLVAPLGLIFQAGMAFHRFGGGELTGMEAYKECTKVPLTRVGIALMNVSALIFLGLFFSMWLGPGSALALANWLFAIDVSLLEKLFAFHSTMWLTISLVTTMAILETLWSVAFGLLSWQWQNLNEGSDLLKAIASFEEEHKLELESTFAE